LRVRNAAAATLAAAIAAGGLVLASAGVAGAAAPASPFEVIQKFPTAPNSNGASAIQIRFSGLLAVSGAPPKLSPAVPGRWIVERNVLIFRPSGAFPPDTIVTVTVPGGAGGIRSRTGRELAKRVSWKYETGAGSVLRAQQVLAELGYLPIHFSRATPGTPTVAAAERDVFVPAPGHFAWSWNAPAALRAQWDPGQANAMETGALMSFQSQHDLPVTGALDAAVWSDLVTASRHLSLWRNRTGYSYALANKANPETLTVWHDDKVILVSPANTGGSLTPTTDGTFPVYERLASQVMRGTNPDGSTYADPVSWVAYFNGGDAVHYIDRADYGIPQSLGCVELPYAQAAEAWPYLTIGSLVTVEG
jgi:peptidoglycan hydrolase-like protein with peptidoglycan-binding domain